MNNKIDDDYWLGQGFSLIDGGLDKVYGHIQNLGTYMTRLIGLYSLSSIAEMVFLGITQWWQFTILILPIAFLYGGQWYAEIAKIPKLKEFYVQSPEFCRAAYYDFLEDAKNQLGILKKISIIATASMVLALISNTYIEMENRQAEEDKKTEYSDSNYFNVKSVDESQVYAFEGKMPKNEMVTLTVHYKDSLVSKSPILIPDNGLFQYHETIPVDTIKRQYLEFRLKYPISAMEKKVIIKKLNLKDNRKNSLEKTSSKISDSLQTSLKNILDAI